MPGKNKNGADSVHGLQKDEACSSLRKQVQRPNSSGKTAWMQFNEDADKILHMTPTENIDDKIRGITII